MKKEFLFILLSCFALSANAQGRGPTVKTKDVKAKIAKTEALSFQDRRAQIIDSLVKETSRPLQERDWDYFLAQNKLLQEGAQNHIDREVQYLCHLYDTDCTLFRKVCSGLYFKGEFRPDYAKEAKPFKYIYVTDASGHDTQSIPAEVIYLLQSLRKANPGARILLATEFAQRASAKPPLHFAGSPKIPFFMYGPYESLLQASDQLNIDILGLDDDVTLDTVLGAIKLGDVRLTVPVDSPQIQHIFNEYAQISPGFFEQFKENENDLLYYQTHLREIAQEYQVSAKEVQDLIDQSLLYRTQTLNSILRDFLSRSDWGILQRNLQWTRYIQAVSPFYDIIVTYAGNGHLSGGDVGGGMVTVPDLIQKNHVLFDFYAEEQLPEKDQRFLQQAEDIQQNEQTKKLLEYSYPKEVENEIVDQMNYVMDLPSPQGQQEEPTSYIFIKEKPSHLSTEDLKSLEEGVQKYHLDVFDFVGTDSRVGSAVRINFTVFIPNPGSNEP